MEDTQHIYQVALVLSGCVILLLAVLSVVFVWTIKKWRKMNFTDHMTGLNNRKYLNYYLKTKHKKIVGKSISISLIDIDCFKKYNDFYGHIKGDMVIKEVADTIKECAKGSNVVIRYGGEEMAVLAFNTPQGEELQVAKNIQEELARKNIVHECSDVSKDLTVSMGIYRTEYVGQNIYTLIDKADTALYRAKEQGQNRYEVYEDTSLEENVCVKGD